MLTKLYDNNIWILNFSPKHELYLNRGMYTCKIKKTYIILKTPGINLYFIFIVKLF